MTKIFNATSSKLGSPEEGSAKDISSDFRTDMGLLMGLLLAFPAGLVVGASKGPPSFIRGFQSSKGGLIHKIACGLFQGYTGGATGIDHTYLNVLDAFVKAGDLK